MTDIMKLADDYAECMYLRREKHEARAALQSAIDALQGENERLKDINRDALSNLNEICDLKNAEIAALQAKLNELQRLEPVAIAEGHVLLWIAGRELDSERDHYLYAAPKALEPLTDERIDELEDAAFRDYMEGRIDCYTYAVARAIEAAHGITKGTP